MEGLIPLVYRTLKKTKTRRQYECLSAGAPAQAYDIADFYVRSPGLNQSHFYMESSDNSVAEKSMGSCGHRRRMSTGDISDGMKITGGSQAPAGPKRFGMLSCVTGC
ncbi:hypothetical protein HRI_003288500 [Hibiscus trionum]|uniref:Uncharacterized protein n=1 Tax=Hibiscus trionum TaxID=183268 RepID=A0A9W7IGJ6_HIBTR|nr:hypothetical protein HRI_003288500 [Hibiscus trionum]